MQTDSPPQRGQDSTTAPGPVWFHYFFRSIETLVDKFGWPGVCFILCYVFVVKYASLEQKQALIDTYLLGKGIDQWYPIGVVVAVACLLLLAQDVWWRRKDRIKQREIDRLSQWKSDHQEQNIGAKLHHTQDFREGG